MEPLSYQTTTENRQPPFTLSMRRLLFAWALLSLTNESLYSIVKSPAERIEQAVSFGTQAYWVLGEAARLLFIPLALLMLVACLMRSPWVRSAVVVLLWITCGTYAAYIATMIGSVLRFKASILSDLSAATPFAAPMLIAATVPTIALVQLACPNRRESERSASWWAAAALLALVALWWFVDLSRYFQKHLEWTSSHISKPLSIAREYLRGLGIFVIILSLGRRKHHTLAAMAVPVSAALTCLVVVTQMYHFATDPTITSTVRQNALRNSWYSIASSLIDLAFAILFPLAIAAGVRRRPSSQVAEPGDNRSVV